MKLSLSLSLFAFAASALTKVATATGTIRGVEIAHRETTRALATTEDLRAEFMGRKFNFFDAASAPGYFIQHSNFEAMFDNRHGSVVASGDTEFWIWECVNAATASCGSNELCVSIESANYNWHYLRHSGYAMKLHDRRHADGSYDDDASFCMSKTASNKVAFRGARTFVDFYIQHYGPNSQLRISELFPSAHYEFQYMDQGNGQVGESCWDDGGCDYNYAPTCSGVQEPNTPGTCVLGVKEQFCSDGSQCESGVCATFKKYKFDWRHDPSGNYMCTGTKQLGEGCGDDLDCQSRECNGAGLCFNPAF